MYITVKYALFLKYVHENISKFHLHRQLLNLVLVRAKQCHTFKKFKKLKKYISENMLKINNRFGWHMYYLSLYIHICKFVKLYILICWPLMKELPKESSNIDYLASDVSVPALGNIFFHFIWDLRIYFWDNFELCGGSIVDKNIEIREIWTCFACFEIF